MAITISPKLFVKKREELGLSLREVAEKTGVNYGTISNFENDKHTPDALNLMKLMIFYGLRNEEIVLAD